MELTPEESRLLASALKREADRQEWEQLDASLKAAEREYGRMEFEKDWLHGEQLMADHRGPYSCYLARARLPQPIIPSLIHSDRDMENYLESMRVHFWKRPALFGKENTISSYVFLVAVLAILAMLFSARAAQGGAA